MAPKQTICVVTGGAGFIGSHVTEALLKKNYSVRVFDDLSTGFMRNIAPFKGKLDFIKGDIRSPTQLKKAFKGAQYIFHLAAVRAVQRSVDNPQETHEINGTGVLNVLDEARRAHAKRVVYTSSSAIYGDIKQFPSKETSLPSPESPYGALKLLGEHYARVFWKEYGLSTVSLRYFNVFGPRQNPESKYSTVIPVFIECLLKGVSPEIHWDGLQSRDFNFIDNITHANLLAMKKKGIDGEVFNIATNEEKSVLDIFYAIQKIMKTKSIKPRFHPKRPGDVRRTLADIRKSKRLLGFKKQTSFLPGLKETVQWFLETQGPLKQR